MTVVALFSALEKYRGGQVDVLDKKKNLSSNLDLTGKMNTIRSSTEMYKALFQAVCLTKLITFEHTMDFGEHGKVTFKLSSELITFQAECLRLLAEADIKKIQNKFIEFTNFTRPCCWLMALAVLNCLEKENVYESVKAIVVELMKDVGHLYEVHIQEISGFVESASWKIINDLQRIPIVCTTFTVKFDVPDASSNSFVAEQLCISFIEPGGDGKITKKYVAVNSTAWEGGLDCRTNKCDIRKLVAELLQNTYDAVSRDYNGMQTGGYGEGAKVAFVLLLRVFNVQELTIKVSLAEDKTPRGEVTMDNTSGVMCVSGVNISTSAFTAMAMVIGASDKTSVDLASTRNAVIQYEITHAAFGNKSSRNVSFNGAKKLYKTEITFQLNETRAMEKCGEFTLQNDPVNMFRESFLTNALAAHQTTSIVEFKGGRIYFHLYSIPPASRNAGLLVYQNALFVGETKLVPGGGSYILEVYSSEVTVYQKNRERPLRLTSFLHYAQTYSQMNPEQLEVKHAEVFRLIKDVTELKSLDLLQKIMFSVVENKELKELWSKSKIVPVREEDVEIFNELEISDVTTLIIPATVHADYVFTLFDMCNLYNRARLDIQDFIDDDTHLKTILQRINTLRGVNARQVSLNIVLKRMAIDSRVMRFLNKYKYFYKTFDGANYSDNLITYYEDELQIYIVTRQGSFVTALQNLRDRNLITYAESVEASAFTEQQIATRKEQQAIKDAEAEQERQKALERHKKKNGTEETDNDAAKKAKEKEEKRKAEDERKAEEEEQKRKAEVNAKGNDENKSDGKGTGTEAKSEKGNGGNKSDGKGTDEKKTGQQNQSGSGNTIPDVRDIENAQKGGMGETNGLFKSSDILLHEGNVRTKVNGKYTFTGSGSKIEAISLSETKQNLLNEEETKIAKMYFPSTLDRVIARANESNVTSAISRELSARKYGPVNLTEADKEGQNMNCFVAALFVTLCLKMTGVRNVTLMTGTSHAIVGIVKDDDSDSLVAVDPTESLISEASSSGALGTGSLPDVSRLPNIPSMRYVEVTELVSSTPLQGVRGSFGSVDMSLMNNGTVKFQLQKNPIIFEGRGERLLNVTDLKQTNKSLLTDSEEEIGQKYFKDTLQRISSNERSVLQAIHDELSGRATDTLSVNMNAADGVKSNMGIDLASIITTLALRGRGCNAFVMNGVSCTIVGVMGNSGLQVIDPSFSLKIERDEPVVSTSGLSVRNLKSLKLTPGRMQEIDGDVKNPEKNNLLICRLVKKKNKSYHQIEMLQTIKYDGDGRRETSFVLDIRTEATYKVLATGKLETFDSGIVKQIMELFLGQTRNVYFLDTSSKTMYANKLKNEFKKTAP
jgi:hypothetical protein